MFKGLRVRNFRAFKDAALTPNKITILLGPNNSGKSSLVQAIRLLAQTAAFVDSNGELSASPLTLSGPDISILDPRELFYNRVNEEMEISSTFQFRGDEDIDQQKWARTINQIISLVTKIGLTSKSTTLRRDSRRIYARNQRDPDDHYTRQNASQLVVTVKDVFNDLMETGELDDESSRRILELLCAIYPIDVSGADRQIKPYNTRKADIKKQFDLFRNELVAGLSFASFIVNAARQQKEFFITHCFIIQEGSDGPKLAMKQVDIVVDGKLIFRAFSPDGNDSNISVEVKFPDLEAKEHVINTVVCKHLLSLERNAFRIFDVKSGVIWVLVINAIIDYAKRSLISTQPSYVGPYRSKPLSVYVLADSTKGGDYILDVAKRVSSNETEIVRLNELASVFGFHITFNKLFESVCSISIGNKNSLIKPYHISSVGFGLVHLIPILDKLVNLEDNTIVFIEQPEAHLHPSLHAELADMFVRMSMRYPKCKIVIETHSDHLLSRLARRIRDGKYISNNDLSIFYIEQDAEGISSVSTLRVDERGDFRWPKGFIESKLSDEIGTLSALSP